MKIKSIKLHNFMRYKGDNELKFSLDKEKNVTVVLGDNTFGKTTLAQAFRWGLYESINDTSYTKRKDVVLLNNEVAASLKDSQVADVYVEIVVVDDNKELCFTRKASFNRKIPNSNNLTVKQIGSTQLTVQVYANGKWGTVIDDKGGSFDSKRYKPGCVQEMIDNMLPQSLSNYFFFDGERWNDLKSKTNDIKDSVDTILGIKSVMEMMDHLKDNRGSVYKKFREKLKGVSGEYQRIQSEIKGLDNTIESYEQQIQNSKNALVSVERTIESTQKTLDDNRKVEEDQKELKNIENDIETYERFKATSYADIVKELSNSAKLFTSMLLPEFEKMLEKVNLEGKDIPGVTIDTLEYLINNGECLCGSKLVEGSEELANIELLKKQVPPEMLGGAAGKLRDTLEAWANETSDMIENIISKANEYDLAQGTIDDRVSAKERLEKTIDRKTNLGPVRTQNKQACAKRAELNRNITTYEIRLESAINSKKTKEAQLDIIAKNDKQNEQVYRCLDYVDAIYDRASIFLKSRKNKVINDLNSIIGDNFQRMFNDHEKYAKLGEDYRIHVYYHQVGNVTNKEEENLSNGETIAINFVFIVSILELAKKYKEEEADDFEYGMENVVLQLPLVLDGPFSSLSNENTSLVAKRLPEFAEQVIIFMLDKDWDASGLEDFTLPEYCYRVYKESTSNSSSLDKN